MFILWNIFKGRLASVHSYCINKYWLTFLYREYKPEYDRRRKQRLAQEQQEKEESLEKLKKDLAAAGEGSEVKLAASELSTYIISSIGIAQWL